MSTTANQRDPFGTPEGLEQWHRLQRAAVGAAVGGVVLFLAVALLLYALDALPTPAQLLVSYLVAYSFWLGIALGCLVILMLQHLTGGVWGILIRRVLESSSRTLLLLAVLFVPLLAGVPYLYLWAQPGIIEHDAGLMQKSIWYLNMPFFLARTGLYFLVWLAIAYFLNRWSAAQDQEMNPRLERRFRLLSAGGLVLYGGTITFAAIDWVMSLEPSWYSTIYPVLFATGQVLAGFAFAIAVLVYLAGSPPLAGVVKRQHLRDLGSLLLAFVMFWAYMSISQFLLIWAEDLPEEIPYYLRRTRGGWEWLAMLIVVFHFSLPFLLLLSRDIKENGRLLASVAIGLLVMRFVDLFWWIEPAVGHEGQYLFWLLDIAALIGLGGIWMWVFLWQLSKRPLLPIHDPYLPEVMPHA